MKKDNNSTLRENYNKACNAYVAALLSSWDIPKHYTWWVSDDIGGTLMIDDDSTALTMEEIIYIVENNITYEECLEWIDYCVWASQFEKATPNLKSWHNGCPRVSKQERFSNLQLKSEKAIKETKDK